MQQNNVIYYLTTVNVLFTSILRCVRVVISKHNFFFCGSQHVQLTSPVYNNNHGLTLWSHVMGHGSEFVG